MQTETPVSITGQVHIEGARERRQQDIGLNLIRTGRTVENTCLDCLNGWLRNKIPNVAQLIPLDNAKYNPTLDWSTTNTIIARTVRSAT